MDSLVRGIFLLLIVSPLVCFQSRVRSCLPSLSLSAMQVFDLILSLFDLFDFRCRRIRLVQFSSSILINFSIFVLHPLTMLSRYLFCYSIQFFICQYLLFNFSSMFCKTLEMNSSTLVSVRLDQL